MNALVRALLITSILVCLFIAGCYHGKALAEKEPCPDQFAPDTVYRIINNGGIVPAVKNTAGTKVKSQKSPKSDVEIIQNDTSALDTFNSNEELYQGFYHDSIVNITTTAFLNKKTCSVSKFNIEYSANMHTIHTTTKVKNTAALSWYITAAPTFQNQQNGCSIGLMVLQQRLAYSFGYDPYQERYQALIGFKIR